jgi:hypothetical protein
MAKRNPKKKAVEMNEDDVSEENVESEPSEAPPEPTMRAVKKAKKGAKVVPIQKVMVTCERFVRGKGVLGNVYAQMIRMENDGKVKKRTVEEWTGLYDKWLKAPRG